MQKLKNNITLNLLKLIRP